MATLNNIADINKRRQIARNLQVHAWYLSTINSGVIFDHNLYTLKVQRGLYSPGPAEKPTATSVNGLAMEGRCVIYELVNKGSGQVETSKTYDLAVYLKDFIPFDRLILDYDTYDPSGKLMASIIITTPTILETYVNIKWGNQVETRNNNKVVASDLVEVFQQPGGAIDTRKPPVGGPSANGISGVLPADGVVQARNKNPNSLPKQNIIDAVAVAVRNLGPGYQAVITPIGGIAPRASGTINHILGDAMDFQLKFNGNFVYPTDKNREIQALYRKLLITLRDNANAKGIRPGIGGYDNSADGQFIHYDEAPHRQGKLGRVGTWQFGFDTQFLA